MNNKLGVITITFTQQELSLIDISLRLAQDQYNKGANHFKETDPQIAEQFQRQADQLSPILEKLES